MTARQLRALVLPLALALVAGLAACGDDGDDEEAGSGSASATGSEATETTESTTTTEPADSTDSADGDAAGEAVRTVFDSAVAFEDKVASLEGGEAHRADHEGYVGAAQAVGGITVEPTDVAVDGDTATVTYRVLFAGNEMYRDLTMDVTRVDDAWVVPTAEFCDFLASAGTPCAAG